MMNLKYVSAENIVLDLSGFPYALQDTDAFNYVWSYDYSAASDRGINLTRFYRNSKEIQMSVVFHADTEAEVVNAMNNFFTVTEKDVINKTPGRLILDDKSYIQCYIISAENTYWNNGIRTNARACTFLFPYPFGVTEATKNFYPVSGGETEQDFLDYPYDYNYDFAREVSGIKTWTLDHYAKSDFKMTIYGYCEEPRILINGYPYQIFDTIEENEFVVIDSRDNTVIKYLNNGTTENIFDLRNKEQSVFEQLPAGNLTITWGGNFGFDVTAFLERSEARWGA